MSKDDEPTRMIRRANKKPTDNLFVDIDSDSMLDETIRTDREDETKKSDFTDFTKDIDEDNELTQVAYPRSKGDQPATDYMRDPVVGWLVVLKGKGQGYSAPIGRGMNSIGRGRDQRVVLDFGDERMSRVHATISYDHESRVFYVQHGGGKNLTYVEKDSKLVPVLTPITIESGQKIKVGDTMLVFIRFCGEDFDWDDL